MFQNIKISTMYDLKPCVADDFHLEKYSRLLSEVFPETKKFSPAFLKWQYAGNPVGTIVGYDAWFENELAAHYATIPVIYNNNSYPLKGLLSLNTATHIEHQRKGLFIQLAEKSYELAASMGYEFVIGVANQNSTHGFINKLGFRLISPLDVKVGLGKLIAHKRNQFFHSEWNKENISWRLNNPSNHYQKTKSGIYSQTTIPLIKSVLTINNTDFECSSQSQFKTPLKIWIGLNAVEKFNGIWMNLPEKLKPAPLNLIFKDLSAKGFHPEKKDFFFELIDFDAY